MSAPREVWADRACEAAPAVLAKYTRVEAALPELSRICGKVLNANALRSALRLRGLPMPTTMLAGASTRFASSLAIPGLFTPIPDQAATTPPAPPAAPVPELDPIDAQRARLEGRRVKEQNQELLDRIIELEKHQRFVDEIGSSRLVVPEIKARERSGEREATAFALASDWHVEERVFPEQIGNRNAYDLSIADTRITRYFRGLRWLIQNGRSAFKIRDLVLWLGGDLITGYIHEELEESNELSPVEAILWLQGRLIAGIKYLLGDSELERIIVPCSFGNHGRIHQRKRIKTGAQNSFEWLMYNFLKEYFKDEPRVLFVVDKSAHQYVQVYDWTAHFHHGDELKYGGGVGGVAIPINKRIPKWDLVKQADIHCIGHFHTYMDLGRITTNGSLIGYTEYAMSFGGDYEPPQQAFFLMDSKRGKTMCSPIWVDEHARSIEAA